MISRLQHVAGIILLSCLLPGESVRADQLEDHAIAGIAKLGGRVVSDPKSQGNPVVLVYLTGPNVTDAALEQLSELTQLRFLDLGFSHVTDAGLKHVAACKNLQVLGLAGTKVTDAGLDQLVSLPHLRTLVLMRTAVTDAGLRELRRMNNLQVLNLGATKTTASGRSALQTALPKLKIIDLPATGASAGQMKWDLTKPVVIPKDSKIDVDFVYDFTDLKFNSGDAKKDAALKGACGTFVDTTRNHVYPVLRELTGVQVGKHFKQIQYTILAADSVSETAGGVTVGNHIRLAERYSVGMSDGHPRDVHEMIHLFNNCSNTIHGSSDHIWHGPLMDAVCTHLGLRPDFPESTISSENKRIRGRIEELPKMPAKDAYMLRTAILSDQLALLYFHLGEKAITRLYQSTINPHPRSRPSQAMVQAWATEAEAEKIEAFLDVLKGAYNFTFDQETRKACAFP
jgi:hypothetical protein